MQRSFHAVLLSIAGLGLLGCSNGSSYDSKPKKDASAATPSASPGQTSPLPQPTATSKTQSAGLEPQSPPSASGATGGTPSAGKELTALPRSAAAPVAPAATTPPVAAAIAPLIQLSMGVALAQTGLDGTLMSFSVDYECTQGKLPSADGVWVIERAQGAAAKQKVQISGQGTLQMLIQGWRPEQGPFHSHLEDLKGTRLSGSIEMSQTQ